MEYVFKNTGEKVVGSTVEIDGITHPKQAFSNLDELMPVKQVPDFNHDTHIYERVDGHEENGEWVVFNIREKNSEELLEGVLSKRASEYPDIGDQLDDLFKQGAFSDEMAAKLQAVKDNNPK